MSTMFTCTPCSARRARITRAARSGDIARAFVEAAKGAAELTGLKDKTALEEDATEASTTLRVSPVRKPTVLE